jgi:hypothetical protein
MKLKLKYKITKNNLNKKKIDFTFKNILIINIFLKCWLNLSNNLYTINLCMNLIKKKILIA